jgi:hypothetical protein
VSKKLGEWYQKTNKTEDTNELTLLIFKITAILYNILLATGRKPYMAAIQENVTAVLRSIPKESFGDSFQKLYERCQQCVVKDGDYLEAQYS